MTERRNPDDGYRTIRVPRWAYETLSELVSEIETHGLNRLPWEVRARAAEYEKPTARGHVAGYAFLIALGVAAPAKAASETAAPATPSAPKKQPKRTKG